MDGVGICKVLLIAGSLVGTSVTLAAAADQDRGRASAGARIEAAPKAPSPVVRRRAPKRAAVRVHRPADWPLYWPYRPYEQVAIRWPILFIGVGY
jgi:hypothetical protein